MKQVIFILVILSRPKQGKQVFFLPDRFFPHKVSVLSWHFQGYPGPLAGSRQHLHPALQLLDPVPDRCKSPTWTGSGLEIADRGRLRTNKELGKFLMGEMASIFTGD